MKYKICKTVVYYHTYSNGIYELHEDIKYFIQRKGRIFGFWHDVGEWTTDWNGDKFLFRDYFDSLESAESFLKCWHKETYNNKSYEIIKYELL